MKKDIVILGCGGFGREVAWLIERINAQRDTWNLLGFLDNNADLQGDTIGGYPVLGGDEYLTGRELWAVCAIGASATRKKVTEKIKRAGNVKFATLIDPDAILSGRVSVGEGSIICAASTITVDVRIGRHAIVNLDCTLGHDAVIGDYVTLYPSVNVSGMVTIGECSEAGTGTQIRQGITVGSRVILGAGAVVVKDIGEAGTYVGVPAKKIK